MNKKCIELEKSQKELEYLGFVTIKVHFMSLFLVFCIDYTPFGFLFSIFKKENFFLFFLPLPFIVQHILLHLLTTSDLAVT